MRLIAVALCSLILTGGSEAMGRYADDWGTKKRVWKTRVQPTGPNTSRYTTRFKTQPAPKKAWSNVVAVKINGKRIEPIFKRSRQVFLAGRGAMVSVRDRPGKGPLEFRAANTRKKSTKPIRLKVKYQLDTRDPWLRHPDPSAPKNQRPR